MNRMRRLGLAALAAVALSALAAVALSTCASKQIDVRTPDFSALGDGTYRGSFDGGLVKATVDVSIAGGRIEKVAIVEHRCGKGRPAEAITGEVVSKQSLDVDVVSGATRSSKVILKAIETALAR